VDSAFHGALLLRIVRIANYGLQVNTKNTELQKINCEMKNIVSEALKLQLLREAIIAFGE
jgi:hypothetical protein